jgi:hypothetical protein
MKTAPWLIAGVLSVAVASRFVASATKESYNIAAILKA